MKCSAAVCPANSDNCTDMLTTRKLATIFSVLAVGAIVAPVFALKVTEPTAAAHAYPGLCDMNGKKLADGEFRQWVENNRLHVVITYKFSAGEVYEEHAQFRQQAELIQEKWSWKESKHGMSQREFAVDFLTGIASAHIRQDNKECLQKD
jgi:K+-transporting ATPase A subunit